MYVAPIAYRPEIDGLRAVAVLAVVLFHTGVDGFSGGFVGVDVFFVISGYLITSILLTDLSHDRLSLRRFYESRARRILPALLFVLLVCLPTAWLWLQPRALAEFGESLVYVCAFVANLFFYDHSDYFEGEIALKPLAHTWSLAAEEQYYLVFPLLLLLLAKLRQVWMTRVLAMIAVASLFYAQHLVELSPQAAFYLLPSRIWELLLGALLAVHHRALPSAAPPLGDARKAELGGCVGIAMIACAVVLYDAETEFPGLTALLPSAGAALVIAYAGPSTAIGRTLASRPFVFVGLISYSTYLWHQPLIAFLRHSGVELSAPALAWLVTMGSLLLGYASWRFVELPFRDVTRVSTIRLVVSVTMTASALALAGWVVYDQRGFEEHYYAHRANEAEKRVRALQQARREDHRDGERHADDGACRFRTDVLDESFRTRFATCAARHGSAVVILGDSHGMNIHNALHSADFGRPFMVGLIKGGCRADNLRAACPYAAFLRFAKTQSASIRQVIYHQSGSYFIADPTGTIDSNAAFKTPQSYSLRVAGADRAMSYLDQLAAVVPTVWLGPFTEARVELGKPSDDGRLHMNPVALEAFAALDQGLQAAARQNDSKWRYISILEIMAMDRDFLVHGDCLTFQDSDHLSACGERIVGQRLVRSLVSRL